MGEHNFTRFKIMEEIAKGRVKIIPDLIVSGSGEGSEGSLSGLMGLQLLQMLQEGKSGKNGGGTAVADPPKPDPK